MIDLIYLILNYNIKKNSKRTWIFGFNFWAKIKFAIIITMNSLQTPDNGDDN